MPRKVIKKLERVVSTKILQSEYDWIMERAKVLHSKGKIAQPTVSAFLRYLLRKYLEDEQPIPIEVKNLARILRDGQPMTTEMMVRCVNYAVASKLLSLEQNQF